MLIGCLRTYGLLHMTMAAEIRANEVQSDRHTIDRSGAVSMYVGEMEKRLNKIFIKGEPNNLMLSFGEANVIMGKLSTVNHGGGTF